MYQLSPAVFYAHDPVANTETVSRHSPSRHLPSEGLNRAAGVSLCSISEVIASFSTINLLYRLGKLFAQSKCSHRNKFDARHSAEYPQSLYNHNVYWMLVQCTFTNASVSAAQECSRKSMKRKSLEHFHLQSSVIIAFFSCPETSFRSSSGIQAFSPSPTLRKIKWDLHRLCIRNLEHFLQFSSTKT